MPLHPVLARMREASTSVLPSLLLCDFGNLEREIRALEEAGVAGLHLDVMDGHFVPNMTYGLTIVDACRRLTELPLDVHLMIDNPERYVAKYAEAGADVITVHVEAVDEPHAALAAIRDSGAAAGLALNPPTPLDAVLDSLQQCDMLLVMSVMPGFGGQSFEPVALEKLRRLRDAAGDDVLLEVDGGVNLETIGACGQAGADLFVVGSAIFRSGDSTPATGYPARVAGLARETQPT